MAAHASLAGRVLGTDGTWVPSGGGSWTEPANWSSAPLIPDGIDDRAIFGKGSVLGRQITLPRAITLGSLLIDQSTVHHIQVAPESEAALRMQASTGLARIELTGTSPQSAQPQSLSVPLILESPTLINLHAGSSFGGSLRISGPMSGSGDMTISRAQTVFLSGDNRQYAGSLNITDDAFVVVEHAAALGLSSAPTAVPSGSLQFDADAAEPVTVLQAGRVVMGSKAPAISAPITLRGGTLTSVSTGTPSIVAQPLQVEGVGIVRAVNAGFPLVLASGASGDGDLYLTSVTVAGGLTHSGNTYVVNGDVRFNAPTQLNLLQTLGNTERPRAIFNSDAEAQRVLIERSGELITAHGKILTVHEHIAAYDYGTIDADLRGVPLMITGEATIQRIGENSPLSVEVHRGGQLNVSSGGALGQSSVPTRIMSRYGASVGIMAGLTVPESFQLNNARGGREGAPLWAFAGATLTGSVDLGNEGAVIKGTSGNERLVLAGPVSGGLLTASGHIDLAYGSSTHRATEVAGDGNLRITGAGYLAQAEPLQVRGVLIVHNAPGAASDDRISDTTPIELHGALLHMEFPQDLPVTERIHRVHLASGISQFGFSSTSNAAPVTLNIGELRREPGATLALSRRMGWETSHRVQLDSSPVLDDGIVGGWVIDARSSPVFVTYGASGLTPLLNYADLAVAGAQDNAQVVGFNATLATSKSVNSLRMNTSLNLNANTLNIESGGLLIAAGSFTNLTNGTITAGGDRAGAELFIFNSGNLTFSASITDNPGGAVSLVQSGGGQLFLSATNTYSGSTFINDGTLLVDTPESFPSGSPLVINGGGFRTRYASNTPLEFSSVVLRGGGYIQPAGTTAAIDAGAYLLEWGNIYSSLTGVGPITKTTIDEVRVHQASPGYTGRIRVEAGKLIIPGLNAVHDVLINGELVGTVTPAAGRRLQGNGLLSGRATLGDGAILAPGNSVGTIHLDSAEFGPGGIFEWEIRSASGSAGLDWDLVDVTTTLVSSATRQRPFELHLSTLGADGRPGLLSDFDESRAYRWTLITTGTVSNLQGIPLVVDAQSFLNPATGSFSVLATSNQMVLTYTPVPEPGSGAVWALVMMTIAARRRRSRWAAPVPQQYRFPRSAGPLCRRCRAGVGG